MKKALLVLGVVALAACSDATTATNPTQMSGSMLKPSATVTTSGTIVVSPADMNGWYFWNDKNDTFTGSPGELVSGPASPPLGTGSVRLGPLTDAGTTAAGHSVIATDAYAGTLLSEITSLSYSTYQPGPTLAIALQFDVRYRPLDASYGGRLVFEPYQTVGTVGSGWRTWSPLAGKWWASNTTSAGSDGVCGHATPCTWSEIVSAFPDAIVAHRFLLKAGSNWTGFDGNADALSIGVNGVTTVFDFESALGSCDVSVSGTTITLESNCVTDRTVLIPNGFTLDGNDHSITAVDPAGGHFLGAVVMNAGASANVHDLTVNASGLANVCDGGAGRLRGILFEGASGSILDNTVTANQGPSGCQEGNAIEARNEPFDKTGTSDKAVTISGNTVSSYIKNGITANGSVIATITNNIVTGNGPLGVPYAAQNGIQIGFGATATVKDNTVTGNDYTPASWVACGILLFDADGARVSSNSLSGNEKNMCNYGKGGGKADASN